MADIDATVEALLAAPLGCAFLLAMDESHIAPAEVGDPALAFAIAARAVNETEIWQPDYAELVPQITERAQPLRDLARTLLQQADIAWWFAPLDREQQLCILLQEQELSTGATAPSPASIRSPSTPVTDFERYAQKPVSVWTSTLVNGEACMRSFIDQGVGDWDARRHPLPQWRMTVEPNVRVYEIDGPEAWHQLCVRHPVSVGGMARNFAEKSGRLSDSTRLSVNWEAAAKDWDAVHLTFGGLLLSEQVSWETAVGHSVMWGWESEMTVWLRWAFGAVERLPNHERARPRPIRFPSIRTTPSRASKHFGPGSTRTEPIDLPEPPGEVPGVRLVALDGKRQSVREGEPVLVQWGADRSRDIRRIDEPFPWPPRLRIYEEADAVVRFDTPTPPTLIEITTFNRVDENGHPAGERSRFKCERVPLFGDASPCGLRLVERDGAEGWELPLSTPGPGVYYLSVWAQWVPPVVPRDLRQGEGPWAGRVFLAGWPFAIECI